jgi:GWxTD domain-containing protein
MSTAGTPPTEGLVFMTTLPFPIWITFLLHAAIVALCICPLAHTQSDGDTQRVAVSGISSELPKVYQRWLHEDVRWIIAPEERTAFLQLSKREERDRFVEQFWLRRDPTPDTIENEYKEEHYRRIAYANEHFAQAVPGWETDRGRVYILYGPPDRIKTESAHSAGESGKPTVLWHYDSMPGHPRAIDLIFVDTCSCGEYRLETPLKGW